MEIFSVNIMWECAVLLKLYHGTSSKRGSRICGNDKTLRQGFRLNGHDCIYFAEDLETAKFFAIEKATDAAATALNMGNKEMVPKNISIIEFSIPLVLAVGLGLAETDRMPLGQHSGMSFPDISGGSGFERILVGEPNIMRFNEEFAAGLIQHRRLRFPK